MCGWSVKSARFEDWAKKGEVCGAECDGISGGFDEGGGGIKASEGKVRKGEEVTRDGFKEFVPL